MENLRAIFYIATESLAYIFIKVEDSEQFGDILDAVLTLGCHCCVCGKKVTKKREELLDFQDIILRSDSEVASTCKSRILSIKACLTCTRNTRFWLVSLIHVRDMSIDSDDAEALRRRTLGMKPCSICSIGSCTQQ